MPEYIYKNEKVANARMQGLIRAEARAWEAVAKLISNTNLGNMKRSNLLTTARGANKLYEHENKLPLSSKEHLLIAKLRKLVNRSINALAVKHHVINSQANKNYHRHVQAIRIVKNTKEQIRKNHASRVANRIVTKPTSTLHKLPPNMTRTIRSLARKN